MRLESVLVEPQSPRPARAISENSRQPASSPRSSSSSTGRSAVSSLIAAQDRIPGATGLQIKRERSEPAYTLNDSSRTNPHRNMPRSRARSTASVDGAPDRHDAREPGEAGLLYELERGPAADAGEHPGERKARRPGAMPIALSIALWRPTSSRSTMQLAGVRRRAPVAWRPPVRAKARCASRARGRRGEDRSGVSGARGAAGGASLAHVLERALAADSAHELR